MVAYSVLGCRIPEINNIGVISKREYTSIVNILAEQAGRPMQSGFLVEPCIAGTSCQVVDKNDPMITTT